MSTEPIYETKSKVPQLNEHEITEWLAEFKGHLMKYSRSHLAIENTRPERDEARIAELTAGPNPEVNLRRYEVDLKDRQDDWDERNDIATSNLIDSTKDVNNSEARQIIFDSLKDKLTAKEICSALVTRFDSVDPRVINAVIRRWTSLKIVPGERATSFITRLKELRENLRKKGKTFTDGELVGRLLEGLNGEPRYAMNVAAMEIVKNLTFEDAVTQLQTKDTAEFLVSDVGNETAAMATSSSEQQTRKNMSGGRGGGERCQICKKTGHSAAKCRFRYNKKDEGGEDKGKSKDDLSSKFKNKKGVKCYNCGKMGHYANECRQPDQRKQGKQKRDNGDTRNGSETDSKKIKYEKGENNSGGQGPWDRDEFSGMMRERDGDQA
jgi:hypothetical protein